MAVHSLSLCAGVGGIDLGLRIADPTIKTVCYVEWGHFPAAVIAARIKDGCMDDAPIWDDVTSFDGKPWRGTVDLITAGFPCQPVSLAGQRKGMSDERFIWADIERIISEVEPGYVFLENVPGIVSADGGWFLDRVLSGLVQLGFDCEWDLFSAEETGAPHRRNRWFCLGNTSRTRQQGYGSADRVPTQLTGDHSTGDHVGNPTSDRLQGRHVVTRAWRKHVDAEQTVADADSRHGDWWPESRNGRTGRLATCSVYPPARNDYDAWQRVPTDAQPAFRRVVDGLADGLDASLFEYRAHRLRAVGNGVVPLTAALAWRELNDRIGR